MIKVALVISNLEYGGAQRQLIELINSSAGLDIEYSLISLSDTNPLAQQLNNSSVFHIVRKNWKLDVSTAYRLARLLRTLDVDIVHGFLFDAEIACRLAAWLSGGRVCIGSERNSNYELKRIQYFTYKATKSLRRACIANSYAGAEFNAGMLNYPPDHYRVVPNGVDTSRFVPRDRVHATKELGIDSKFRWVGMIGSFKQRKNHRVFFRTAKQLTERFDDVRFLLVGDVLAGGKHGSDDYKVDLMHELGDLKIEPYCVFLGNRADVESVYPACELTVLPSLHEGTPNVALESMSCGVPVVAADVSDNSRVIPNGEAGIIVPVNDVARTVDAISDLLTDSNLSSFGVRARTWIEERFSSVIFARNMRDTYEELFGKFKRTPD